MAASISLAPGTVSGVVLVTLTVTDTQHHVQIEISPDGVNWSRLCAKNRASPWEANFNTWRFPNGDYQLRVSEYAFAANNTRIGVSAPVAITISNPVGTIRDYVGGVDLFSAAITAASNGDTIRLSGTFASEGTVNINKRVRVVKHPNAASATIQSRTRTTADGVYVQGINFAGANSGSPLAEAKAAVFTNCDITNGATAIGMQEASTIPFDSDGSFDTLVENCTIHDCGNRTTQSNSAHGIYAQNSLRLFVTNSAIYRSAARQIQLYPQALQATIYKSVLYDSEQAVVFGGDTSTGAGMDDPNPARVFKTSYATVERCIVGKGGGLDSSGSDGLIYVNWNNGVGAGIGNEVLENFMHDPPTGGFGAGHYIDTAAGGLIDAGGNIFGGVPGYTDATNGNFKLVTGAAARGYGPDAGGVMANIREVFSSGITRILAQPAAQPGDFFPPGIMLQFGGSVAPANWLICDGSAVSRVTYAALFSAIGSAYGNGDGVNTFNVPDFRDRIPVGKSGTKALGSTGGAETHTLSAAEMPVHSHVISSEAPSTGTESADHVHNAPGNAQFYGSGGSFFAGLTNTGGSFNVLIGPTTGGRSAAHTHTVNSHAHGGATAPVGSGGSHNNMQPYLVVNHIIKI